MASEPGMGTWTDLLHSSTKLLDQAASSSQFPPLQRNLDQLEALSKKLKAKTLRTEVPSQTIAATRLLAREGINAEQLARDLKSFELKTTFEDVFPAEATGVEEYLQQRMSSSTHSFGASHGLRVANPNCQVNCQCLKRATIQVMQSDRNGNLGRLYYSCFFNFEGSKKKCEFFRWLENAEDEAEYVSRRDNTRINQLVQMIDNTLTELKGEVNEVKSMVQQARDGGNELKVLVQNVLDVAKFAAVVFFVFLFLIYQKVLVQNVLDVAKFAALVFFVFLFLIYHSK